jgi:hypothetical protein
MQNIKHAKLDWLICTQLWTWFLLCQNKQNNGVVQKWEMQLKFHAGKPSLFNLHPAVQPLYCDHVFCLFNAIVLLGLFMSVPGLYIICVQNLCKDSAFWRLRGVTLCVLQFTNPPLLLKICPKSLKVPSLFLTSLCTHTCTHPRLSFF